MTGVQTCALPICIPVVLVVSAAVGKGAAAWPGLFRPDAPAHPGVCEHLLQALLAGGGPLAIFRHHRPNRAGGGGDYAGVRQSKVQGPKSKVPLTPALSPSDG